MNLFSNIVQITPCLIYMWQLFPQFVQRLKSTFCVCSHEIADSGELGGHEGGGGQWGGGGQQGPQHDFFSMSFSLGVRVFWTHALFLCTRLPWCEMNIPLPNFRWNGSALKKKIENHLSVWQLYPWLSLWGKRLLKRLSYSLSEFLKELLLSVTILSQSFS